MDTNSTSKSTRGINMTKKGGIRLVRACGNGDQVEPSVHKNPRLHIFKMADLFEF